MTLKYSIDKNFEPSEYIKRMTYYIGNDTEFIGGFCILTGNEPIKVEITKFRIHSLEPYTTGLLQLLTKSYEVLDYISYDNIDAATTLDEIKRVWKFYHKIPCVKEYRHLSVFMIRDYFKPVTFSSDSLVNYIIKNKILSRLDVEILNSFPGYHDLKSKVSEYYPMALDHTP